MTALADAARELLAAKDALAVPYVPTAQNSRSVRDVNARRLQRIEVAYDLLRLAVAATDWPQAWHDGDRVHKVRVDGRAACLGPRDPSDDVFDRRSRTVSTGEVLTIDNACPDCDWGLR